MRKCRPVRETASTAQFFSPRFIAEPHFFPEGRLYLSCIAQIEDLWETTVDEIVFGASNITKTHLFVRNSGEKFKILSRALKASKSEP